MEKECSVYKVVYKQIPQDGCTMTKYGLEVTIYGEDIEQIDTRLFETLGDMEVVNRNFRMISIERK